MTSRNKLRTKIKINDLRIAVERLHDIRVEIGQLLDEAIEIYEKWGDDPDIARSYWYAHIKMSLGEEGEYVGGDEVSLQQNVEELESALEEMESRNR